MQLINCWLGARVPTPEQVTEAIALISKRGANLAYFFERLDSPEWIKPLWDKGFFRNPKPAERSGDSIRFPVWPESRYLVRMAGKEPELVHDVLLEIPSSDNERVHEDLLEAAAEMPPSIGKDIAAKEAEWIASQEWIHLLLPEKARRLVRRLAEGGEVAAAVNLWTALLSLQDTPGEPTARLRPWDYAEVLRLTTPSLVATDPLGALRVLRDLLKTAVDKWTSEGDGKTDYSIIWRPAIDETGDRPSHDKIEDALVSAARDAAKQAVEADPARILDVVDTLLAGESIIFTRLVLHLLSEYPDADVDVLNRFLCDADLFDNWLVRHEYVLLMRNGFEVASEDCQECILRWIDAGPDPERAHDRLSQRLDREPTTDEAQEYRRRWQRDRLTPMRSHLNATWSERYRSLVEEFGDVPDPDFLAFRFEGVWEGESSPKSLDELREMAPKDIADYLRTWEPSDDPRGPSEGGLASVLERLATEDGDRISTKAGLFIGLRPTYVRGLFAGLAAYLDKGPVEWQGALRLAHWVVSTRKAESRRAGLVPEEPSLRWAADAALDLMRDGMAKQNTGLTITDREAVWKVVSELIDDPEPSPSHEEEALESTWDALTLSSNTTRGKAMDALMIYIVWIARSTGRDATRADSGLLSRMPEAVEALERHLDLSHDPSLAIRSVYGRRFAWLVAVDVEWSSKNATTIFVTEPSLRAYWDAAWPAYLTNDTLNRNVFRILTGQYRHAISLLGSENAVKNTPVNPEEALGNHMMLLYLNADLELGDGTLLFSFYEQAPDKVRAHAMGFVGRLSGNDGFTDEMRTRAMLLWKSRLGRARTQPESHKEEMRAFGWWFASETLDRKWAIENLEGALEFGAGVDVEHKVAERLADLAPEWPTRTVRCLRYLIKADTEGWGIYAWKESIRSIVTMGLKDDEAQDLAQQVVNELLASGHFEYRDLLLKRMS
jgi:hypothetical protein